MFDYRDKSGKQLARILSGTPSSHGIVPLSDCTGESTKDVLKKLEIFQDYFQKSYTSEEVENEHIEEFLDKLTLPSFAEDHVAMLEATIRSKETAEAIKAMKPNTAPSPDGYTPEYYKRFKDSLLPYLTNLFQAHVEGNKSPESWAEAKITVLPKQRKDLTLPQFYRPISLLNTYHSVNDKT